MSSVWAEPCARHKTGSNSASDKNQPTILMSFIDSPGVLGEQDPIRPTATHREYRNMEEHRLTRAALLIFNSRCAARLSACSKALREHRTANGHQGKCAAQTAGLISYGSSSRWARDRSRRERP